MKREEFLSELRRRLDRLPQEELENVLDYYDEIFLDAGAENEEQTAENLGSIDDIVRQIYVENGISPDGRPEFVMGDAIDNRGEQNGYTEQNGGYRQANVGDNIMSLLGKIAIAILLFPIWFPLMLVGIVLSLVFSLVGIILDFVLGAVGISFLVVGMITIFTVPPLGLVMTGAGLIMTGIFALIAVPVCKGAWRGLVRLCNSFAEKFHGLFFSKGAA